VNIWLRRWLPEALQWNISSLLDSDILFAWILVGLLSQALQSILSVRSIHGQLCSEQFVEDAPTFVVASIVGLSPASVAQVRPRNWSLGSTFALHLLQKESRSKYRRSQCQRVDMDGERERGGGVPDAQASADL